MLPVVVFSSPSSQHVVQSEVEEAVVVSAKVVSVKEAGGGAGASCFGEGGLEAGVGAGAGSLSGGSGAGCFVVLSAVFSMARARLLVGWFVEE